MCLRLYRLCGNYGDRTIDYYFFQFLLAREEALHNFCSKVDYPWAAMDLSSAPQYLSINKRFWKWHGGKTIDQI
jgi:hypothetical protein